MIYSFVREIDGIAIVVYRTGRREILRAMLPFCLFYVGNGFYLKKTCGYIAL